MRFRRLYVVVWWSLLCLVPVGVLAHPVVLGFQRGYVPWAVAGVVVAAVFVAAAVRSWRICLITTDTHLVVKNFWRTWHIEWSDISKIEPPRSGTGGAIMIRHRGGREVKAAAFAVARIDSHADTQRMVDHLRQCVATLGKSKRAGFDRPW